MARRIPALYGSEVYASSKELKDRVEPWEYSHPEGNYIMPSGLFVALEAGKEVISYVHNQI